MKIAFTLAFALFVLSGSLQAQEESPWPPDPSEIFAPGVEIVAVEHSFRIQQIFRPPYDNDARVIFVRGNENQADVSIPFPSEVTDFVDAQPISSNQVLLTANLGSTRERIIGYWILDTETNSLSQPELICNRPHFPDRNEWFVYYEDRGSLPPELCNMGTGERIILPAEMIAGDFLDEDEEVTLSPNGERAVLFGYAGVYIYTFRTGQLMRFGDVSAWDIRSAAWLGNNLVLISETEMADMSFPWRIYSLGNASLENSLEQITTVYKPAEITIRDNPRRIEWMSYDDDNCTLIQVNMRTGSRDEYPSEDICDLGIILTGEDDRLYSAINRLIRYNPYSGERRILFEGEIEMILDISTDSRYAVVILDSNGRFDMLDFDRDFYSEAEEGELPPPLNFSLAIIDLETGNVLYQKPVRGERRVSPFVPSFLREEDGTVSSNFVGNMRAWPLASMYSIGNGRFILEETDPPQSMLVEISDQEILETLVEQVLVVTEDAAHLVTYSDVDEHRTLRAYNVETKENSVLMDDVTVLENGAVQTHGFYFNVVKGHTSDTVEVIVSRLEEEMVEEIHYTIRLP